MNILLINPPIRENAPPSSIPIGLATIASVMLNDGHNVTVLDINAHRYSFDEVLEKLDVNNAYDVIGLGGLITTYKYLKNLIPEVRVRNPKSKIIIGGGVVTESPTLLLSKTPADIAVIGEGEHTVIEILKVSENNHSLKKISGIAYKDNQNKIQVNSPRPLIKNLDEIPLPAYHLFPMDIYLNIQWESRILGKKREMNLITGRGCPYDCDFCYHIFSRGVRVRSIENVIEEIKILVKQYQVNALLISDETFTLNNKRIMEFCDKLKEENLKISWTCYGRVNLVNPEILSYMKSAGCFRLGFGIESGSQKILNLMNKKQTVEQAEAAIKIVRNAGLICGTTFMFGYPGETRETIEETIQFCKQLYITPKFFYTAPYPGTQLFERVKDRILSIFGSIEHYYEALGDAFDFVINLTDFTDNELIELKESAEQIIKNIPVYKYPIYYLSLYKQVGLKNGVRKLFQKKTTYFDNNR